MPERAYELLEEDKVELRYEPRVYVHAGLYDYLREKAAHIPDVEEWPLSRLLPWVRAVCDAYRDLNYPSLFREYGRGALEQELKRRGLIPEINVCGWFLGQQPARGG
ncbi:hypothetical protein FJY63_06320 [Candidatus Sumerlaeota bacterium]|nr:hypothetical protein [Candidatus Sumerlaeota bacterium]